MSTTKPIFRIFDYHKTKEFYVDWLGFTIAWEKRFSEDSPVYMQISLGEIILHLSEHHGDGTPGSHVFIEDFKGLTEFHKQLIEKNYKYNKPGLEKAFWDENTLTMDVVDPFNNRILFTERL